MQLISTLINLDSDNLQLMNSKWTSDKGHALCFPVVACLNACSLSSCHRIWMIVIRILPTNCYNCLKIRSSLFITGDRPWLMYDFSLQCFHHMWGSMTELLSNSTGKVQKEMNMKHVNNMLMVAQGQKKLAIPQCSWHIGAFRSTYSCACL